MEALQSEKNGYYGFAKNGLWHGGVHFSRALNEEDSVHCIANGEIVACRIAKQYETAKKAKYSTAFVLVRHCLELPNDAKDTEYFYSLYLHLAASSELNDKPEPTFWEKTEMSGEIEVPNQPIPIKAGELVGYLGQFQPQEKAGEDGDYAMLHLEVFADATLKDFINAGRHCDTTLPTSEKPWLVVAAGAQTAKTLPSDTTVKHALHTGKGAAGWAQVQPCAKGIVRKEKTLNDFNNNSYQNSNTVRNAVSRQSGTDDSLLTSDRAYWDGYYYDSNKKRNTEAAHFDTHYNASATDTHRGVLLPYGDPVWINTQVQEKNTPYNAENTDAWHFPFSIDTLEEPKATEEQILFIKDIEATIEEQRDDETIQWYKITFATEDGEHTGWICSQDQPHVSLHSQWAWPGFEIINNTFLTIEQYYARQMLAGGNVTDDERESFKEDALAVEKSELFERIYQFYDKQDDNLLPPEDIPNVMRSPKVQQGLSRFIIEQPTEWQGSEPWSCLDEYMHEEAKPDWDATKEQIDKLEWWDEVNTQAELNLSSNVMNVHPVALVGNFYRTSHNAYLTFKTTKGIYSISKEAVELILESEGYRQHPYVPAASTTSSGITIGYGYDLGHQTKSSIENSLKDFFSHQELELLKNSAGLKGVAAELHLNKTPSLKA